MQYVHKHTFTYKKGITQIFNFASATKNSFSFRTNHSYVKYRQVAVFTF